MRKALILGLVIGVFLLGQIDSAWAGDFFGGAYGEVISSILNKVEKWKKPKSGAYNYHRLIERVQALILFEPSDEIKIMSADPHVIGGESSLPPIEGTHVVEGGYVIGGIPNKHVIGGGAYNVVVRSDLIENLDSMPTGMRVTLKEETSIDSDEKIWTEAGSVFKVVKKEGEKCLEPVRLRNPYALQGAQLGEFTLVDEKVDLDKDLNPEVGAVLKADKDTAVDDDEKIFTGAGSVYEVTGVNKDGSLSLEPTEAKNAYAIQGAQFGEFTLVDERVNLDKDLNPEVGVELKANKDTAVDDDAKIFTEAGSVYEVTGVNKDGSLSLELTELKNPYAVQGAQFGEFTLVDERVNLDKDLNPEVGVEFKADKDTPVDDDEKVFTGAGSVYEVAGVNKDGSLSLELTEAKDPYAVKGAQFGKFTLVDERVNLDKDLNPEVGAELKANNDITVDDDEKVFTGAGSVYEVTGVNKDGSLSLELTEAKDPYAVQGAQLGEFTLVDERVNLDKDLNPEVGAELKANNDITVDDDEKVFTGAGSVYEVAGVNKDGSLSLELTEAKDPYAVKGAQFGKFTLVDERVNLDKDLNPEVGAELKANNDITVDDDEKVFTGAGSVYEVTGVNKDGSLSLELTEARNAYAVQGAQFGEFTLVDEGVNLDKDLNPEVGAELVATNDIALDKKIDNKEQKIFTGAGSKYKVTGVDEEGKMIVEPIVLVEPYALLGAKIGKFTLVDVEVTAANQDRIVRNNKGDIIGVTLDENLLPPVGSYLDGSFKSAGRTGATAKHGQIIAIDEEKGQAEIEEIGCHNKVPDTYFPFGPIPESTGIPGAEGALSYIIPFSDLSVSVDPIGLETSEAEIEGFQESVIISGGDKQPDGSTHISIEIPGTGITLFIDIPISQLKIDRSAIEFNLGNEKKPPTEHLGNPEQPPTEHLGNQEQPATVDTSNQEQPEAVDTSSQEEVVIHHLGNQEQPEIEHLGNQEQPEAVDTSSQEEVVIHHLGNQEQPEIEHLGNQEQPEAVDTSSQEQPEIEHLGNQEQPEAVDTSSQEQSTIVNTSDAVIIGNQEQPEAVDTSSQEQTTTVDTSDTLIIGNQEQPEAVDTSSQEQTTTVDTSDTLIIGNQEQPEAVDTSSQEQTTTVDTSDTLIIGNKEKPAVVHL